MGSAQLCFCLVERKSVVEYDLGRSAYEEEVARLTEEWKQQQKKNAQRKAAIQMATGLMINDEEDCSRVLDQQTEGIQDLHQKQKMLEVGCARDRIVGVK